MLTFLLVLLFLGILIAVHEFGHFIACRIQHIGVEEFSIGFGPRVLSFTDKVGTRYSLSLIPFGGYVKIKGEEKSENPEPGDFWIQPFYKKIFVVISGPVFNLILALVVFGLGYSLVGYETIPIYRVYKVESEIASLQAGDSIIAIDGKFVSTLEDLYYYFSKKDKHILLIERGNQKVTIELLGKNFDSLRVIFAIPPIVNRIEKGSPAHRAGLKKGDKIVRFNNTPVSLWQEVVDSIRNYPGKEIRLAVERGGNILEFLITPLVETTPNNEKIGRIGITAPSVKKRLNIFEAFRVSITRSLEITWIYIVYLMRLFRGKVPLSNLGGPIMIGKVIYTASSYGLFQLLYLLGLISINLFIINLIPLPALDGWHFLVYLIEGITKRELSPEVKRVLQLIGFTILLILMIVIAFFDILRIVR
uniref:Zinc metalloprotease n=1 Tax=candidate division WOR-3 bacterium TaxID=2052148 RepID=A0A7V3ZZA8_UNCW3